MPATLVPVLESAGVAKSSDLLVFSAKLRDFEKKLCGIAASSQVAIGELAAGFGSGRCLSLVVIRR